MMKHEVSNLMETAETVSSGHVTKPAVLLEPLQNSLLNKYGVQDFDGLVNSAFTASYLPIYFIQDESVAKGPTPYRSLLFAYAMRKAFPKSPPPFNPASGPDKEFVPLSNLFTDNRELLTNEVHAYLLPLKENDQFSKAPYLYIFQALRKFYVRTEDTTSFEEEKKVSVGKELPFALKVLQRVIDLACNYCESICAGLEAKIMPCYQRACADKGDYMEYLSVLVLFKDQWDNYFNSCVALRNYFKQAEDILNWVISELFHHKVSDPMVFWAELAKIFSFKCFHKLESSLAILFLYTINDFTRRIAHEHVVGRIRMDNFHCVTSSKASLEINNVWNTLMDMYLDDKNIKEVIKCKDCIFKSTLSQEVLNSICSRDLNELKEIAEKKYAEVESKPTLTQEEFVLNTLTMYGALVSFWLDQNETVLKKVIESGFDYIEKTITEHLPNELLADTFDHNSPSMTLALFIEQKYKEPEKVKEKLKDLYKPLNQWQGRARKEHEGLEHKIENKRYDEKKYWEIYGQYI